MVEKGKGRESEGGGGVRKEKEGGEESGRESVCSKGETSELIFLFVCVCVCL